MSANLTIALTRSLNRSQVVKYYNHCTKVKLVFPSLISLILCRWQSSVAPRHLDSSRLVVEQAGLADMKPKPPVDQLAFGKVFTDHMLTIDWTKDGGWQDPQIKPFADFSVHPGAKVKKEKPK